MAQRTRRKTYRVRYDRIIFVLAIFLVLILILTSCISSCAKKDDGGSSDSVVDNMSDTDVSGNPVNSTIAMTTTEPPITYENVTLAVGDINHGNLILANTANPCDFDTVAIADGTSTDVSLVTIKSILDTKSGSLHYTAKDWEVGLDREAANALDAWLEGFYAASGNSDIRVIDGYRPDAGDIEFHTGRTCTLGIFPDSGSSNVYRPEGTYAWVAENAHNYGFVQRYPDGKESFFDDTITDRTSSTFRYVGVAAATYMKENNLCLEEYLETVKDYTIDNMLKITNGSVSYGVYYAPMNANGATTFSVPGSGTHYEISGNNKDGFVITVTLSGAAPSVTTEPVESEASTEVSTLADPQ